MAILRRLQNNPTISKFLFNHYPPYRGAGIYIEIMNLELCHVRVKMPLTWKNQNLVGTHFGGSLYSMVDPFYMMILLHHLGSKYIVWDKAAEINFLSPGRSTVHADIRVDLAEIEQIRELAENYDPVLRTYHLNIFDESGVRIAEVKKRFISDVKSKTFPAMKISAKKRLFYSINTVLSFFFNRCTSTTTDRTANCSTRVTTQYCFTYHRTNTSSDRTLSRGLLTTALAI